MQNRVFIVIDGSNFYHRLMKKKVEYIGFSHKPSYGLISNSDIRRLLIKDELETG